MPCRTSRMSICPILSPYLSGPWSWTECNNDHVLVVCDHVDGGIRLPGFILTGFMASKNADLLYFDGPWTDYQCHSETTSNQLDCQFEVQLLGLGPCGFPSFFFDFDVQYEVLFHVLLIMTTVKYQDNVDNM